MVQNLYRGAVVFDLDGTLIDSLEDIADALNLTLTELGLDTLPLDTIRTYIGGGARQLLLKALGKPEQVAEAYQHFGPIYAARLTHKTKIFPEIIETLAELRQRGYAPLCATNKPQRFTDPTLAQLGLDQHLLAWASADEVQNKKPAAEVVDLALQRAGLTVGQLEQLYYVGDMRVDVQTARNANAQAVGVSWGFDPEGTQDEGPDIWLEKPKALLRHLFRLGGV